MCIQLGQLIAFFGHFYMGDTYIVLDVSSFFCLLIYSLCLQTFFNESSELDWNIYYWIGREASVCWLTR